MGINVRLNRSALSCLLLILAGQSLALSQSPRATVVIDSSRFALLDTAVKSAIADGQLPGAVVLVSHRGETIYQKAFGQRAIDPVAEPMTLDTIFDLASLTKVVATTTSLMILVEEGRVRLSDAVAKHLPGFERYGKDEITVADLLTHMSGLRSNLPLEEEFDGYDLAIERAINEVPVGPPRTEFIYSDINFFVLGEIVARVSESSLDTFARERLFDPLGMRDTMFLPPSRLMSRIAPTERCTPLGWPCGTTEGMMLRGTVHDPTARRMGGVAGHAGLFSNAKDLARFAEMLLGGGTVEGARILAPLTVAKMTTPATPSNIGDRRGLGWDIDSRYSSNRGDLFSSGSFGHTGFTGLSLWIDPSTETAVIFLSNRVHPDGKGNVTALRGLVATLAAAAITGVSPMDHDVIDTRVVDTGVDVLRGAGFARLQGARVGLLTNQTGRARDGVSTIDLLHEAPNVHLLALFTPEHGIRGTLDAGVPNSDDPTTGLPIYSLYGSTRRPTPTMLDGLDTIVIDLQDVGTRFYTYATTMAYMLEAAADLGLRVIVLDRPNPVTGATIEGPGLDDIEEVRSFTGYFSMPIRHGMTVGELARLFNGERDIGAELEVVPLDGWRRKLWFDQTGIAWVDPSPNLRSVTQATLYPGIGSIEGTNLSVGRGTEKPFEQLGAPWIDGNQVAVVLNRRGLPGVRFYPVSFTPVSSKYAGEVCEGVFLIVTNRNLLRPVRTGLEIAAALYRLYPASFDLDAAVRLLGSRDALERVKAGDNPATIAADWTDGENAWRQLREPYLLYP